MAGPVPLHGCQSAAGQPLCHPFLGEGKDGCTFHGFLTLWGVQIRPVPLQGATCEPSGASRWGHEEALTGLGAWFADNARRLGEGLKTSRAHARQMRRL
jgi:hypothetical protein